MTDASSLRSFAVPPAARASYPPRPGNMVRLLVDGEPAFRRVCEAIDAAQRSVWATVTFLWAACRMPDGRGAPLKVLSRAAARGLDVRLIFWRPDPETARLRANAFWGAPEHFALLRASASAVRIRWDRAHPGYCQHQKSWLIDAGAETATAFLGGINLNPHSVVSPGHRGAGHNHDAYVELAGPSVADVHHNFVQRWNGASERHLTDGRWGAGSEDDLPFPASVPDRKGDATAQIQRTIHPGRYADGHAAPQHTSYDISQGEASLFEQYCAAIEAARRSIYVENQQIDVPQIIECFRRALLRGVELVAVVPAEGPIPEGLRALASFDNFTLSGIAGLDESGRRMPVWVHSKLMLIDGEWGTVGSCNLHRHSLFGNGEMNVSFWDRGTARRLLSGLLYEHLDTDTKALDDRSSLRLFGRIARDNRRRSDGGDSRWQGLAFSLLPGS